MVKVAKMKQPFNYLVNHNICVFCFVLFKLFGVGRQSGGYKGITIQKFQSYHVDLYHSVNIFLQSGKYKEDDNIYFAACICEDPI